MLLEIDEVVVPRELWLGALRGEAEAKDCLRKLVQGLELYMHAFPALDGHVCTLRELEALGIVESITVKVKP